jgi:L-arabinonolactonase
LESAGSTEATLFVDCRCTLGEGIVWWRERAALVWTDITESRLWMHDASGTRSWALPDRVGSLAPCESGRLIVGLAKGLAFVDVNGAAADRLPIVPLADVELDIPSTRVNDGRTDRSGNFVFGTMCEADGHPALGSFYQWSMRAGLRRLDLPHAGIANSICFSPDGRTMYFCDSPTNRIMRARYDADAASVADVRPLVELDSPEASPDGSIVDADGCLWNATWRAAVVRRYRPDGRMDREVPLRAKNPTCPVFGGARMNELFVTSARQDMTPDELERVPHAGGVYRALVDDVRGIPDRPFADR